MSSHLPGYADNADADALNVGLGAQVVDLADFAREVWTQANRSANGDTAQETIETTGLSTASLLMREDGMRDRSVAADD